MSGPGDHQTYDANGVMASVYDPVLKALRISGSGSSGAPADASYVTTASESGLSNEKVLGTAVIMGGVLGSRPAASIAGRLYAATDNNVLYRDTGSAWTSIGTANAVVLNPASSATNVVQATADVTELTLKAFAGQTAPLLDLKDSTGASQFTVDPVTGATPDVRQAFGFAVRTAPDSLNSGPDYYWNEGTLASTELAAAWGLLGDAFPRVQIETDGSMSWSDGTVDPAAGSGPFLIPSGTNGLQIYNSTDARFDLNGNTFSLIAGPSGAVSLSLHSSAAFLEMDAGGLYWNVGGNPATRLTNTGAVISNAHVAPADGDLNNSDFALWLKDTVAANAVNFKAKDSAGTVVTRAYAIKPIDSHTATTAFGSLAVGTPKQNTLGYDILVMGTVDITAATGGSLKLGTGSSATPTTDPITASITTAALSVVGFSAVVPNDYYISLASAGTITLSSPVVIAVPV